MKRWLKWTGILSGLLFLTTAVAITVLLPDAVAFVCPRCYGLSEIAPRVFVETQSTETDRARLIDGLMAAEKRLEAFYPERTTRPPVILACSSSSCDRRLGGKGAKAQAYGAAFIHVSPAGWNTTILAHELAHIELHGRVGWRTLVSGRLPAWFDEGLAVIVSEDPRYLVLKQDGTTECRRPDSDRLPASIGEWGREAGLGERPIYAMAACRVLNWLRHNGGRDAVFALTERLRDGDTFAD